MAKLRVQGEQLPTQEPPEERPSDEQWAEWAREEEEKRQAALAPYRAVHAQQNDQDDLLAELLFEVDLMKLGLDA